MPPLFGRGRFCFRKKLVYTLVSGDRDRLAKFPSMMITHVDSQNLPAMVNVGGKAVTERKAHAVAVVSLPGSLAELLRGGDLASKKGPIYQTAILAGIMGAKRTSDLIPLCHPLALDDCQIEIQGNPERAEITIHCRVCTHARTGVEMEAMMGATIAALTVYDMGKALSREIQIKEVRLLEKTGGKSDYQASSA